MENWRLSACQGTASGKGVCVPGRTGSGDDKFKLSTLAITSLTNIFPGPSYCGRKGLGFERALGFTRGCSVQEFRFPRYQAQDSVEAVSAWGFKDVEVCFQSLPRTHALNVPWEGSRSPN